MESDWILGICLWDCLCNALHRDVSHYKWCRVDIIHIDVHSSFDILENVCPFNRQTKQLPAKRMRHSDRTWYDTFSDRNSKVSESHTFSHDVNVKFNIFAVGLWSQVKCTVHLFGCNWLLAVPCYRFQHFISIRYIRFLAFS